MSPSRIIGTAALATVVIVAGGVVFANRERPYDSSYDTRVSAPAYAQGGPIVLYDEGHLNTHTADGGYKPFADLIQNDGYTLRVTREPMSGRVLDGVAVLVVVLPKGANDANDGPAFTDSETAVIEQWVRSGGSLLLVTDHWPFGLAAKSLARRFDVQVGGGLVEDPEHHEAVRGPSHLIFSRENGLLRSHPIIQGRNADEQIRRVLTFTGQSLSVPKGAISFLALSDAATERPPGPATVDRSGSDLRVSMEYRDPISAAGRAQGLALETGRGRVVILGEAGMLRAERSRSGLVGMNVTGYDNRQLALNIMHWLSRVL